MRRLRRSDLVRLEAFLVLAPVGDWQLALWLPGRGVSWMVR